MAATTFRALVAAVVLASTASGCASRPTARDAAHGTVQGYFDGMDALDPAQRRRVCHDMFADPALLASAEALSRAIGSGAVDALATPEATRATEALGAAIATGLERQLAASGPRMLEELTPALERAVTSAVQAGIVESMRTLHAHAEEDLAPTVRLLVKTALRSAFDELDADIARSGRAAAPLAGAAAHAAAQQAVLGVAAGLRADQGASLRMLETAATRVGEGVGVGLQRSVDRDDSPLHWLLWLAAAVTAALAIVAGLLYARYRRSTRSLSIIAQRINHIATTNAEEARALKRAIHDATEKERVEPWLHRFLRARGL